MSRINVHWRAFVVLGSFVACTVLFNFTDLLVGEFEGVFALIPVLLAAWFFGGRAAVFLAALSGITDSTIAIAGGQSATDVVARELIDGVAIGLIGAAVGTAQAAKRRMTESLTTDHVTTLANRQAFRRRIDRLFVAGHSTVTIALLDLVDFPDVNATFGYDIGDQVLKEAGARFTAAGSEGAFVAKGVRDRFGAVTASATEDDASIAARLLAVVDAPFMVQGQRIQLRAHVGIARRDVTHASSSGDLLRAATEACERAEHLGRPWVAALAMPVLDARSRLQVLSELSHGIANGELRLHYQPIVDLPSRSLRGFEALARWQHPTRGLLMPVDFIPLAERSGLIVPLTEWVLNEAMRQSKEWSGLRLAVHISVNVGAKSLADSAQLPDLVGRLLTTHGVDPSMLVVEVTETDVMSEPTRSIAILRKLKDLGLRIEMDDFGTGYSSLSYLQKLPLDGVKIDRSFIKSLLTDAGTAAIVRAAIDLSHALGLDAIAEGVEDEAVLDGLAGQACDAAQGYFIARPMPGQQVPGWIAAHDPGKRAVRAARAQTIDPAVRTVLVVDDAHPFRVAAHRILTAQGYRVVHAATASEAMRICAELNGNISLLLTDIHLSDWRGDDLAERLQSQYPAIRTMFMSGDPNGRVAAGTDVFLAKPFSNRELVDQVAEALAS